MTTPDPRDKLDSSNSQLLTYSRFEKRELLLLSVCLQVRVRVLFIGFQGR